MGFDCIKRFSPKSCPIREISCWRSPSTGLRAVLADIDGPLVNGFFALATESNCDDGCPHTLEHLIFLGSEDYPYKGVLDELANRNLSQGTNAWTDTDHTAYTLTTAGEDGFLSLLPVYLDHILYPTITDAGFVTEVHHITESGANAGVVYCEMQARENTGPSRCHLALMRKCFPGHGYSSETGGMMHALRTLTVDTIRQYHRAYYRPENLCLIITGPVNRDRLWRALEPFEKKVIAKGPRDPYERPWMAPVPALATAEEIVEFPTDDESMGSVHIAFHGPTWSALKEKTVLSLLWQYLTDSAVSPLQKALVECESPLCGDISHSLTELSTALSTVTFNDAPTETLLDIKPRMFAVLHDIVQGDFDLKRMRSLVGKALREYRASLEEHPHAVVSGKAIEVFLYGDTLADIENEFDAERIYGSLEHESTDFWLRFLKEFVLDSPHVTVIGKPSGSLSDTMQRVESERVAAQAGALGETGLKDCGRTLEEAEATNMVAAPHSVFKDFPVPDIDRIPSIPIKTIHNIAIDGSRGMSGNHPVVEELRSLPFSIQVDQITTRFVEVRALSNTHHLPDELRPYLDLYAELLFESDAVRWPAREGPVLTHEEVIAALYSEAVSYAAHTGHRSQPFSCGSFSQLFNVALKFPTELYSDAVAWMRTFLTGVSFTQERLQVVATRLLSSIAGQKRRGDKVAGCGIQKMMFGSTSNHIALSVFNQESFLERVLKADPEQELARLRSLQKLLAQSVSFHVIIDVDYPGSISEPWRACFGDLKISPVRSQFPFSNLCLKPFVKDDGSNVAITVAGLESSYLYRSGPFVPASFTHDCCAPLRVVIEYLTACEGPFWKRIRGLGYAYSYSISADFESGLATLLLFKATNVVAAYSEAAGVVQELISEGASAFTELGVEAAKAALSFEILSARENAVDTARESLDDLLRNVPPGHESRLLKAVQAVTADQMYDALRMYISPIFNSAESRLVCATGPSTAPEVVDQFKEHFDLHLQAATPEEFFVR
ncbi:unnamed protein product (mitochondrion) [Plasmodiophora brassicae]|uniref:Uncharacterized protein n=1 Tax=Plasmodiophora brassicae TaxID=37360 RepID=A0A0G4IW74_PLABS|nr:hypothetical protein PBRA_001222 [Plasmodiophora brassicae]SPQ97331.1 unnamed protein product [Plasmodiophora brassicae]